MNDFNRKFKLGDAVFMEYAFRVSRTLPNDISDFSAFDTTMGEHTIAEISDGIEIVNNIKTDNIVIDELAEHTARVESIMEQCRLSYNHIMYFVKKAFPGNKPIHNQFGANDYLKSRKNHEKMIFFMQAMDKMVVKYRRELIQAGCTPFSIDKVNVLSNELANTNSDQESFKKEKGIVTFDRIDALNALYKLLLPIGEIARIIYADNPAKQDVYTLPQPKNSSVPEEDDDDDEVDDNEVDEDMNEEQ